MKYPKNYEIRCQNCMIPLGKFVENNIEMPNIDDLEKQPQTIEQFINEEVSLITFKCPNCDCITQVKLGKNN